MKVEMIVAMLKRYVLGIVVIIVLTITVFLGFVFSKSINSKITQNIYGQISETSSQAVVSINYYINEQHNTLSAIADYLSTVDDLKSENVYTLLNDLVRNKDFLRTSINFPDGSRITNDRRQNDNVEQEEFFKRSIRGERNIVGPKQSIAEPSKSVISLSVPIFKNSKVVASLTATIDTDMLDKIFNLSFLNNQGVIFITTKDGTIITNSFGIDSLKKGINFINRIEENSRDNQYRKLFVDKFRQGDTNVNLIEEDANGIFYINFTKAGIADWYVFTVASKEFFTKQILGIENDVIQLSVLVLICIIILVAIIIYDQVDERKKAVLNARCLHVLAAQTGNIIFEWDFSSKKLTSMSSFKDVFGTESLIVDSPQLAVEKQIIHCEDAVKFKEALEELTNGENISKVKFRIQDKQGQYHWCTLSSVVIKDKDGNPFKSIASISNIDEQEKETIELRQKASIDILTEFANKAAVEELVSEVLKISCSRNIHALFSLDLDNFKSINDSFGHLYGDQVLKEVADEIRKIFRSTDIIGRFGGDEFVIFLRDVQSIDAVKEKVYDLLKALEKTYKIGDVSHQISASIGVSLYPKDGYTYQELYAKADEALYIAKHKGKDTYHIYTE